MIVHECVNLHFRGNFFRVRGPNCRIERNDGGADFNAKRSSIARAPRRLDARRAEQDTNCRKKQIRSKPHIVQSEDFSKQLERIFHHPPAREQRSVQEIAATGRSRRLRYR